MTALESARSSREAEVLALTRITLLKEAIRLMPGAGFSQVIGVSPTALASGEANDRVDEGCVQ